MKQTYTGGCQCGAVRYEVEAEINEVYACNCSRCGKLGTLLTFVAPEQFVLKSGADATTEYLFNKKQIHHRFCATCGVQSYARGTSLRSGNEMVAVNVRCLDEVDLDSIPVTKFDGKHLL